MIKIWTFLQQKQNDAIPTIFMLVVESSGSSPGRQGFKMVVAQDGELCGSIGGGVMEHKLVEKAKSMLKKKEQRPVFLRQYHHKKEPKYHSGMICSGEQMVMIYPMIEQRLDELTPLFQVLKTEQPGTLTLNINGFSFLPTPLFSNQFHFTYSNEKEWVYQETIPFQPVLYIIGGGHVSLAFSKIMANLGFYIKIFDDRPGLNTMEQNNFAPEKKIINYEKITQYIPENKKHYVVIMTFGYRKDKIVLRQLIDKKFCFIGMMGSKAKIKQLWQEYQEEGIPSEKLKKVHAPIGLPILSKTPEEIAISIAAQIILFKNKNPPTDRSKKTP